MQRLLLASRFWLSRQEHIENIREREGEREREREGERERERDREG